MIIYGMIRENILQVKENISLICKRLGRDPQEVVLIGVTKYSPKKDVEEALENGLCHIGESRVQQALVKYENLRVPCSAELTRHMIGHLQTNKVKQALQIFDMIQSVDSLRLGQEIERQCANLNRNVDILIQVNPSGEEQKFGVSSREVFSLIEELSALSRIRIRGLMAIAPLSENEKIVRDCFKKARELKSEVREKFKDSRSVQMDFLSMGMSDDYEIALEEGSNMVRIGRAIFS